RRRGSAARGPGVGARRRAARGRTHPRVRRERCGPAPRVPAEGDERSVAPAAPEAEPDHRPRLRPALPGAGPGRWRTAPRSPARARRGVTMRRGTLRDVVVSRRVGLVPVPYTVAVVPEISKDPR